MNIYEERFIHPNYPSKGKFFQISSMSGLALTKSDLLDALPMKRAEEADRRSG